MISKKIFKINDCYGDLAYSNRYGQFFLCNSTRIFAPSQCRETLFEYFTKRNKYIGFCSTALDIDNFSKFWQNIEKKLKLKEKSTIFKTNNKYCVVIKLSKFWRSTGTARQIVTLLLRCGVVFKGNFKKYDLTRNCLPALKRFLSGYTKPTYNRLNSSNYYGFVSKFKKMKIKEINKALIKP